MSTGAGQLHDDAAFFRRHQGMRLRAAGLNEEPDQPVLARILPDVTFTPRSSDA